MNIKIDKSFIKDFNKINDNEIKTKVKSLLLELELFETLKDIPNVKKMKGFDNLFRIALKNYRLGFRYENGEITLIKVMLRKDIYKYFP